MNVNADAKKIASEHYDEALAAGDFSLADVIEEVNKDLVARMVDGDRSVVVQMVWMLARQAVEMIDKARTTSDEATLFDALERPVKLGEGQRLAYGFMTTQNWVTHLGYVAENAAKVNAAAARENYRFAALAPFFTDNTVTTERALALWRAANPGRDLP